MPLVGWTDGCCDVKEGLSMAYSLLFTNIDGQIKGFFVQSVLCSAIRLFNLIESQHDEFIHESILRMIMN